MNNGHCDKIREFIRGVEWCNARNVCFLLDGYHSPERLKVRQKLLYHMAQTKIKPKLLTPSCDFGSVFAHPDSHRGRVGSFLYNHDCKVRDVLAKLGGGKTKGAEKNADGSIGKVLLEVDNGHKSPAQLEDQLKRYRGHGEYVVLFVMAHRDYDPSLPNSTYSIEKCIEQERGRLNMLFEIVERMFKGKPNRLLANTYTEFLKTGVVYNFRKEDKTALLRQMTD